LDKEAVSQRRIRQAVPWPAARLPRVFRNTLWLLKSLT